MRVRSLLCCSLKAAKLSWIPEALSGEHSESRVVAVLRLHGHPRFPPAPSISCQPSKALLEPERSTLCEESGV